MTNMQWHGVRAAFCCYRNISWVFPSSGPSRTVRSTGIPTLLTMCSICKIIFPSLCHRTPRNGGHWQNHPSVISTRAIHTKEIPGITTKRTRTCILRKTVNVWSWKLHKENKWYLQVLLILIFWIVLLPISLSIQIMSAVNFFDNTPFTLDNTTQTPTQKVRLRQHLLCETPPKITVLNSYSISSQ